MGHLIQLGHECLDWGHLAQYVLCRGNEISGPLNDMEILDLLTVQGC